MTVHVNLLARLRSCKTLTLDDGDGVLHPVLANNIILNENPRRRAQLGDNPTPESLISLVRETIALNSKQALVMRKLLSEILAWVDYPYDSSRRKATSSLHNRRRWHR
jgi:hypothetical protein